MGNHFRLFFRMMITLVCTFMKYVRHQMYHQSR